SDSPSLLATQAVHNRGRRVLMGDGCHDARITAVASKHEVGDPRPMFEVGILSEPFDPVRRIGDTCFPGPGTDPGGGQPRELHHVLSAADRCIDFLIRWPCRSLPVEQRWDQKADHRLLWNNMMAGKTQIDGQVGTCQLLTIDRKRRRNDVLLSLLRSSANSSE